MVLGEHVRFLDDLERVLERMCRGFSFII